MTDNEKERDGFYPKVDDVERIVRQARQMRADVMRAGLVKFWSMLRRNMPHLSTTEKMRHA